MEIFLILEECWREIDRLHQSAAEFRSACARSERFLTGGEASLLGASADPYRPQPYCQTWRQKAQQTRELAHRVTVAKAKPLLLEIADSYDRLHEQ